jgi:hypothetical protein
MDISQIKTFNPLMAQLFTKELGKYASNSGVNKLSHLLSAIDLGINFIGWEELINFIKSDLDRLKKLEEETKDKNIISHFKNKDWNSLYNLLEILRPKLADIQLRYDEIQKKKMDFDKGEDSKIRNYREKAKLVSAYQPELYYLLDAILRKTNMQMSLIKNEYLKSAELSEYSKGRSFERPMVHKTESTS